LAQWLSPEFAVKVSRWVLEWFSGGGLRRDALPDHVRRYLVNRPKIPATHFSMLDQMTLKLLAPLEDRGYTIPPRLMPDISMGKMFSAWCRKHGFEPDTFPTYDHEFLPSDKRPVVKARLYPNELITAFNLELENWIRDGRAIRYFKKDGNAIQSIQAIAAALPPPGNDE